MVGASYRRFAGASFHRGGQKRFKEMKIATFNAPAETITDKPMFRDALGRPEITPHNWISEQSRTGMPDEGLGIAAVGLEHFQAAVAFPAGTFERIAALLGEKEDRTDFVRQAVEREIERRQMAAGRKKPKRRR